MPSGATGPCPRIPPGAILTERQERGRRARAIQKQKWLAEHPRTFPELSGPTNSRLTRMGLTTDEDLREAMEHGIPYTYKHFGSVKGAEVYRYLATKFPDKAVEYLRLGEREVGGPNEHLPSERHGHRTITLSSPRDTVVISRDELTHLGRGSRLYIQSPYAIDLVDLIDWLKVHAPELLRGKPGARRTP